MSSLRLIDCLRAKSKKDDDNQINLLLKDHILETVKRAIEIKKTHDNNKEYINYNMNEDFFKKLIKAAFLHDLGKIDYHFQKEVYSWEERQTDEFKVIKKFFDSHDSNITDHEFLSVLYSFLFNDSSDDMGEVRSAILLHHYNDYYNKKNPSINNFITDYPNSLEWLKFISSKQQEFKELVFSLREYVIDSLKDELVSKALNELDIDFNLINGIEKRWNRSFKIKMYEFSLDNTERDKLYEFLFLLGCLRRCDYAASGNVKAEEITNFDIVYKDLEKNIKSNLKEIKEDMWQEELIKSIDSKNLILVAPTGSGKTEFSLLWAKKRGKKLVYTLPLRVALNDLYGRFNGTNENSNCPYFNPTEISILHSTSFVEFLKEKRSMEAIDIEEKVNSAKVFSSPILLTTADQVFLTSLKYYGFDKVLAIYPFTSFVIDEIQAYKPEMMAVIIKTIEMIHKMGGDILIMTATFPPYLNYLDSFISSSGSNIQFDFLDIEKTSIKNKVKNYSIKRHKIKVYDEPLFSYSENKLTINKPNIMKIMEDNKNANIMIVVNNVSKAISLYDDLKNNGNVHIIHSRILEKEKTKRIRDIKEDLKNHKKNIILVATQVVEASVDVDFDILITEISPIESQIQRWGRVWRNRDSDYNKEQPNVHIFLRIDKGTLAIYDKKILEETTRVLKEKDTEKEVLDYISERNLISKVYNENVLNEYMEQIMKNLQWLNYWSAEKRSVAQRIFRTIGGIQVVIPAIMKMSEDVVEKSFGMLLENEGNLHKMKWDDIIDEIKQQAHVERKISEWELKRILYENSVNIPIFAYEKIYLKDFKGFYILKIDDSETVNNIKEYGVNNLKNIDIDNEEIKLSEDNVW